MEVNALGLPGWWEPLANLSSLCEFSLYEAAKSPLSAGDADAFADILANHMTLDVLDLSLADAVIGAVLRRGLPSGLRVLGLGSCQDFEDLLAAAPPDLAVLRITPLQKCSAADVRALVVRFPQLRALSLSCDDEAVAYLASEDLVGRPLFLNRAWFDRQQECER